MLQGNDISDSAPYRTQSSFEAFVIEVEPRLRLALVALYGTEEGSDATAEALAYAWEHRERILGLANPAGYLFRVAQSKSRHRRQPVVFVAPQTIDHTFEPKLPNALRALSEQQRLCVVLIHGFGYPIAEVAELLDVKTTTVRNHLERGLRRLRRTLGVPNAD